MRHQFLNGIWFSFLDRRRWLRRPGLPPSSQLNPNETRSLIYRPEHAANVARSGKSYHGHHSRMAANYWPLPRRAARRSSLATGPTGHPTGQHIVKIGRLSKIGLDQQTPRFTMTSDPFSNSVFLPISRQTACRQTTNDVVQIRGGLAQQVVCLVAAV